MEQQKAAKVYPPTPEPEIIDVDMTRMHLAVSVLSVATIGLTATSVSLWRKVRRLDDDAEALRVLITRLVNDTECGQVAYANVVRRAEAEERGESVPDVSDEFVPYPEEESADEPTPRRVRADRSLRI